MVIIYTGEGKGKTTAALGLALRALGYKKKILIVQFGKNSFSGDYRPLYFFTVYNLQIVGIFGRVDIVNGYFLYSVRYATMLHATLVVHVVNLLRKAVWREKGGDHLYWFNYLLIRSFNKDPSILSISS